MWKHKWILGALVASSIGIVPATASAAFGVYVDVAPPAPRHELVPAPRRGFVWSPGYWDRRHGRFVWVGGHWNASTAACTGIPIAGSSATGAGCSSAADGIGSAGKGIAMPRATATATECPIATTGIATAMACPIATTALRTIRAGSRHRARFADGPAPGPFSFCGADVIRPRRGGIVFFGQRVRKLEVTRSDAQHRWIPTFAPGFHRQRAHGTNG